LLSRCLSCAAPVSDVPSPGAEASSGEPRLALEPAAELDAATSVVRVHLTFPAALAEQPAVALYRGVLSEYHLGRVRRSELPASLTNRRVPSVLWLEGDRELVIAPASPLELGETYSIAGPPRGSYGTFSVGTAPTAYFSRFWPPLEVAGGFNHAVYCGPIGTVPPSQTVQLSPGRVEAALRPGTDDAELAAERCFHLDPSEPLESDVLVPPPALAEIAIHPAPLYRDRALSHEPLACTGEEVELGPGCALVQDDRLILRAWAEPSLWALRSGDLEIVQVSPASGRFAVRGFQPEASNLIELSVTDLAGAVFRASATVHTGERRARVVINEVLANPNGREPGQEWVELINDGVEPVELAELELMDAAGGSPLPDHRLLPGEFALVVSNSFDPQAPGDAPVSQCALLRVAKLGSGGLSNTGERLELRGLMGAVLSRFPALPAAQPGVSLARVSPESLDDEPASFGPHAQPGASPCTPNTF
jgi:hypothetical protein